MPSCEILTMEVFKFINISDIMQYSFSSHNLRKAPISQFGFQFFYISYPTLMYKITHFADIVILKSLQKLSYNSFNSPENELNPFQLVEKERYVLVCVLSVLFLDDVRVFAIYRNFEHYRNTEKTNMFVVPLNGLTCPMLLLFLLLGRLSRSDQYFPQSPVSLTPLTMMWYSSSPFFTIGGAVPGLNCWGSKGGRSLSLGR